MVNALIDWAAQPSTAWTVLGIAALVIFFKALQDCGDLLWSDMIEEDD
jgi:hypothetical protein